MSQTAFQAIAVDDVELISAVGLSGEASFAAMTCNINNYTDTSFQASHDDAVVGAAVPLMPELRGNARLAALAAHSVQNLQLRHPHLDLARIPVLLALPEDTRPGRDAQTNRNLLNDLQTHLSTRFAAGSMLLSCGRPAVALALIEAHRLLHQERHDQVVIIAVDSLLQRAAVLHWLKEGRLLTGKNGYGFIPGEAAGTLLLSRPRAQQRTPTQTQALLITGIGASAEPCTFASDQTNHGKGLAHAMQQALLQAGLASTTKTPDKKHSRLVVTRDFATSIGDCSGETFYFGEAASAKLRVFKDRGQPTQFLLPAQTLGDIGAATGIAAIGWLDFLRRRRMTAVLPALLHFANDDTQRAAVVIQ